ncbi:MAG: hypothetical protein ACRDYC_09790 [Acidimicrobiales bacterium]
MAMPATVERDVDIYLQAVDRALPGLIQGLYVTGSIPLRDYQPGVSDIDMVAICAEKPSDSHLEALGALHRTSNPSIDVVYLNVGDLSRDPRELSPPHSLAGAFKPDGAFNAHLVTWRQLSTASIAMRGPGLTQDDVWFDADALRQWNLANLDRYWVEWTQWWRGVEPEERRVRHKDGLQWLVLGVPRLHHTITTLEVISKTGAAQHALGISPVSMAPRHLLGESTAR